MSRYRYLLGDSRSELSRLNRQSRLWDPTALALFDRISIEPGWRVLEVGPGGGSLHQQLRRRIRGPVDAVERSLEFATALKARSARDGLGAGQIWQMDLREAPLPRAHYDLVFARWVLLFLPDPLAHLRTLVRALKPGGLLAIEDYHRESFALVPRSPDWSDFMAADRAFFASQGGDVSIGGRLPGLYRAAGLEMVEVTPTVKWGRPGSPVWRWLSDYFLGVMDRYARHPPFSAAQATKLRRHWLAAAGEESSLMIAPTLLDVVGRRPLTNERERAPARARAHSSRPSTMGVATAVRERPPRQR